MTKFFIVQWHRWMKIHDYVTQKYQCHRIGDYNRSLTPVGTFDVFVPTAAIFLASKPEPAQ